MCSGVFSDCVYYLSNDSKVVHANCVKYYKCESKLINKNSLSHIVWVIMRTDFRQDSLYSREREIKRTWSHAYKFAALFRFILHFNWLKMVQASEVRVRIRNSLKTSHFGSFFKISRHQPLSRVVI